MRVLDILSESILTEAPLAPSDFKERYRLANLIKKLEKKEPFHAVQGEPVVIDDISQSEINDLKKQLQNNFDPKDPNPKAQSVKPIKVPAILGGVRLSTLQKTDEFGGRLAISAEGEHDYTKANLGPTVEALKSFAMYAKLISRNKDHIDVNDVLAIAKLADKHYF